METNQRGQSENLHSPLEIFYDF